jgi:hypothetical protein
VSALKELVKRQPKIAPIVSTLVCIGIGWERAHSFASAQQSGLDALPESPLGPAAAAAKGEKKIDLPIEGGAEPAAVKKKIILKTDLLQTLPLEQRAVQKFENIKTKQQACAALEGKILTYYDSVAVVLNCQQRPVEDPDLLNELVLRQKKIVSEVPAHVYRLIPFGEPWLANQNQSLTQSKVCRELNGKYVTSTGNDYYFIEACKKRSFSNYVELQAHNKRNAPVLTVPPDQIDKIPNGQALEGNYDREVEALYKIVGDSTLSPMSTKNGRKKPVSSAEELEELPSMKGKSTDLKTICKELNQKVVSFYSQLFFITQCQKRPVKELPIEVQQRFAERGASIIDVSSRQLDLIPMGKEMNEDEALNLIK